MNSSPDPRIFVSIPLLNEADLLPRLMECLSKQTFRDFTVLACINQPDEWWDDPVKKTICESNRRTIDFLESYQGMDIRIIDRSSPGRGWKGKRHGVGWARKTAMDAISRLADDTDLVVSTDADTTFSPRYFASLVETFRENPWAVALSVPYFHRLPQDPVAARAILRYEIYMRYYVLNLWRIGCPYSFTALGSAIALPAGSYRLIGGMTPKMSGEDFYFLQKLRKAGRMLFWNPEKVFPEARFSDRVYFGTGPAMIKGARGDWSGYPVYRHTWFDEIRETYDLFPSFLKKTIQTPVTEFMASQFREADPFQPLRKNFHETGQFVRACHEKLDGLRLLQYLKLRNEQEMTRDEDNLAAFLTGFYPEEKELSGIDLSRFTFDRSPVTELDAIRMFLMREEEKIQVSSALS